MILNMPVWLCPFNSGMHNLVLSISGLYILPLVFPISASSKSVVHILAPSTWVVLILDTVGCASLLNRVFLS